MACKSCSSGACGTVISDGKVAGCNSNGACGTGACNKMNVFDWLSDLDMPSFQRFPYVELKFKGGRKEYVKNADSFELFTGDQVVIDSGNGNSIGIVSLQGELVRLQMMKKGIKESDELGKIIRKANEKDLEKHFQSIEKDLPTMYRTREIINELKLNMKLSDVEFQSDGSKATFFYSSEDRVDFRELIKILASEFKIRIEMRQISLRQEASRVGGIGICGRELCCSTWLTDFKNVTTSAAKYQNLSLNPVKLSGQCGRLKCCLNYELETYMEVLKDIPEIETQIEISKGKCSLQKTDIFKRIMWFSIDRMESNWIPVSCDIVEEIIELNKKGIIPESFENLNPAQKPEKLKASQLNSDLERLNKKFDKDNNNKPKKRPNNNNRRNNRNPKNRKNDNREN
ncbi:MAG: hypothetical protein RIR51_2047 [Bacteroidota bacterium]